MAANSNIRKAIYLDEEHNIRNVLAKDFDIEWVERVLLGEDSHFSWEYDNCYKDLRCALFEYLVDYIGAESCYTVHASLFGSSPLTMRFDVTENDVEGTMDAWTCVTSGSSDNDDEEFEQAYPEVFLSEKEALNCAIEDLKQYIEGGDDDYIKSVLKDAKDDFKRFGRFCYHLNDSYTRRWDIWYSPILLSGEIPQAALTQRKKVKG